MNDKRSEDDSSEDRFEVWIQTATRFFILANAGGAIAVLSFLGSRGPRPDTGEYEPLAISALSFFVLGIVLVGVIILGQLNAAYRKLLFSELGDPVAVEKSIGSHWSTRAMDVIEPRTGRLLTCAFALFVLGSGAGIAGIGGFYPFLALSCALTGIAWLVLRK
jgi:hypothetical protein